jgi:hypothetical protein
VSWARVLGLPIVAAGKSSEYDYVFDPSSSAVTWTDRRAEAPGLAERWYLGDGRARNRDGGESTGGCLAPAQDRA